MQKREIIPPDFIIIPYQVLTDKELEPQDKVVYGVIYWYEHLKNNKCTASNKKIGEIIGVKNSFSIANNLSNLEKKGYIKRIFTDDTKRTRQEIVSLIAYKKVKINVPIESNKVSPDDDRGYHQTVIGVSPDDDRGVSPAGEQKKKSIKEEKKEEAFSLFWEKYPNKKSKKEAEKIWKKINPDSVLFAKILHSLKNQKNSEQWKKENGRFIPHPSTWLNQERWNDEINGNKTIKYLN